MKVLCEIEKEVEPFGAKVEYDNFSGQWRVYCPACLNTIYWLSDKELERDFSELISDIMDAINEHYSKFQCS